jgi:putative Holliday junction resolvase
MRCLALDVGERRTGVAVGEWLAQPLLTLKRRSRAQDYQTIACLVREHSVDRLVVGLPLNMDGSTGFQAQRVVRYAEGLNKALAEMDLQVDLVFWDERLTSEEADRVLASSGHRERDRLSRRDAVAAAVILQSYLDRQAVARG